MRHALLAALIAVTVAACGRGDRKTCEQACRNFATLSFWHKWDPLIKAEPAAEQDKLRRDKLVELEAILANGIDQCVESCSRANNEDQFKCMVKATTYQQVKSCAESEEEAQ